MMQFSTNKTANTYNLYTAQFLTASQQKAIYLKTTDPN